MVASAAAIAIAILSVENPLALVCKRQGVADRHSGQRLAENTSEPELRPGRPPLSRRRPRIAVNCRLPQPEKASPTRDEIALALRAAHQRQPEIRPPATDAPPVRRLDADELATLLKRANGPDRDRRHRSGAIAARTRRRRAGGQRRAAAGSDLRSGGAGNAGCAKHHSRSGESARLVPQGGPVRVTGSAAAPQSNPELDFTTAGDTMKRLVGMAIIAMTMAYGFAARAEEKEYRPGKGQRKPRRRYSSSDRWRQSGP